MTSKTTHIRVDKDVLKEMKRQFPGMRTTDIIKIYKGMYDGVQTAGKIIYGDIWKKQKR